jgi:hypothetical protein
MKNTRFFKKLSLVVMSCICIFWISRIYSVNYNAPYVEKTYSMSDTISLDDLDISVAEWQLYTPDQFKQRFLCDVEDDFYGLETLEIAVCLNIKNASDREIGLDEIDNMTACGFEMDTWCSSVNPFVAQNINKYTSEILEAGETLKIWYVVQVSSVSFKHKNWEKIYDKDFYYVLTLYPEKVRIKLDGRGTE